MSVSGIDAGQVHPIDDFGRQGVEVMAAPLVFGGDVVREIAKAFTPGKYVHREFTNDTPTILQLAHRVIDFYGNYHTNVLRNSYEYAGRVERLVERIVKFPLTPLTYTETGTSIQKLICETLIGTIVFATVYCALQIFHIVPTIVTAIAISSTLLFYQTAPVALITLLASGILLLNVYFLYYLNGEVKVGNRTLKDGFDQAQEKILEVQDEANSLKQLVLHEILPVVKIAAYSVMALAIPSTIAVSTLAYYVLTKRTI